MHTAVPGPTSLPQNLSTVKTYNNVQKTFPGDATPAVVVVRSGDVASPQVAAGIGALRRAAAANPVQAAEHAADQSRPNRCGGGYPDGRIRQRRGLQPGACGTTGDAPPRDRREGAGHDPDVTGDTAETKTSTQR